MPPCAFAGMTVSVSQLQLIFCTQSAGVLPIVPERLIASNEKPAAQVGLVQYHPGFKFLSGRTLQVPEQQTGAAKTLISWLNRLIPLLLNCRHQGLSMSSSCSAGGLPETELFTEKDKYTGAMAPIITGTFGGTAQTLGSGVLLTPLVRVRLQGQCLAQLACPQPVHWQQ